MKQNKVIAVWGNPNSGKTTTAIKLATYLASKSKNVVLIHCDHVVPVLSTTMPFVDAGNKSLGDLLSSPSITQESILEKMILVEKEKHISVLSYLHGENERTYAKYSKERVIDLLILLKHLSDYVIIDCSSDVKHDILSRASLEMSDQVIRLITPDLKSLSFFDSTLPLIAERKFNLQNHIKVISNSKEVMPKEHVASRFGASFELAYAKELEIQFYEGELFLGLHDKKSKTNKEGMDKLQKFLFEENDVPKKKVKDRKKFMFKLPSIKKKAGDVDE